MASQSSQQPFVADYESDDAYFPDDDRSAAPPSSSPSPSSYGDAVDSANDDQYEDEDKDGYGGGGQGEAGEEGEKEEEEEEEEGEGEGERRDIKIPKPLAGSSTSIGNTPLTSLAGIVGTFVEHLECAIHTILYERDIYPRQLFMSTRKYNCPVKMCRVPKVNQYVRQMVEVVGEQLLEGGVQVISVVILSQHRRPLERFNFDVSSFPQVDRRRRSHYPVRYEDDDGWQVQETSTAELYEQFRAVMTQLAVCSAKLARVPDNCTFTLMVEMVDGAGPPVDHTRKWLVAEHEHTPSNNRNAKKKAAAVNSIPLRTVYSGALAMDIWIEESVHKEKLPECSS